MGPCTPIVMNHFVTDANFQTHDEKRAIWVSGINELRDLYRLWSVKIKASSRISLVLGVRFRVSQPWVCTRSCMISGFAHSRTAQKKRKKKTAPYQSEKGERQLNITNLTLELLGILDLRLLLLSLEETVESGNYVAVDLG